MKRSHSDSELCSQKRQKLQPKLPIEVWLLIFDLLPFDDQVNCRLVCKDWLEVISALPSFVNKNHLDLNYHVLSDNDEPVQTILNLNSKLRFGSMKVGNKLTVKNFPNQTIFLSRIGETLTHLDISHAKTTLVYVSQDFDIYDNDTCRMIVENLSSFKVLHQLTINSLHEWIAVATSTYPGGRVLEKMLEWIFGGNCLPVVTFDLVKSILESPNIDFFHQSIFVNRYKDLILNAIKNNMEYLNNERFFNDDIGHDTFGMIINEIEYEIEEADNTLDLAARINTSVKVLKFELGKNDTDLDVSDDELIEKMMTLLPNVQEFHITHIERPTQLGNLRILQKLSDKITGIYVTQINELEELNLRNLKHVQIGSLNDPNEFRIEMVNRMLTLCPRIKTMDVFTFQLPSMHQNYITELHLVSAANNQLQLDLSDLALLKNLQTLTLSMNRAQQNCFCGHQPVLIPTIKKLNFWYYSYKQYCRFCFETLLQSLPNLRSLSYFTELNQQCSDIIFKNQPNLEKLEISEGESLFEPTRDWPEMKRLKTLDIQCDELLENVAAWADFGKKLSKVRYLKVQTRHKSADLLDAIRYDPQFVFPALKKLAIFYYGYLSYKYPRAMVTQKIHLNGRSIVIDKHGNNSWDESF